MFFKERLSQSPHIQGVTRSTFMPGRTTSAAELLNLPLRLKNRPVEETINAARLEADFDFEKTLGINVIAGRSYVKQTNPDPNAPPSFVTEIVLNETAVKHLGIASPEEAIGQPIDSALLFSAIRTMRPVEGRDPPPMTIIGVVEDFHLASLHQPIGPLVLMSSGYGGYAAVRLNGQNITQGLEALKAAWTSLFPDYVLTYSFLDEDFEQLYLSEQRTGNLIGVFSFLAIFIACLGLFGLAAFTTQQRTKEIGIHKVMGASVSHIVVMLSNDFVKLVVIAMPLAWALAYWTMNNWLQSFAYRTDIGVWWFLIAGILALAIALVTVGAKAVKAALVNPVETLRYE